MRAQAVAIVGLAGALAQDLGHGPAGEVPQPLGFHRVRHPQGVGALRSPCPRLLGDKIRKNLEDLREIRVVGRQQRKSPAAAGDQQTRVDRHRLRGHPRDREKPEGVVALDVQSPGLEHPLEGLPDQRLGQGVVEVEDEKPAGGLQDAAGLDAGKVRDQFAGLVDDALDRPEEVPVGRNALDHDRGSGGAGVVHEQVHLVGHEAVARRGRREGELQHRRVRRLLEIVEVREDTLLDLAEVPAHLLLRVALGNDRNERLDQLGGETAHRGFDVVPDLVGDLLLGLDELPGQPLDLLAAVGEQLLALRGERLELLGALDRLAVLLERDEDQLPLTGQLHEHGLLPRLLLESVEELLDLTIEGRSDLLLLALEALLLERLGNAAQQLADEVVHLLAQPPPVPRRNLQNEGAVRVLEVVDVEDVRRRRQAPGFTEDKSADAFLAPRTLEPRKKDVVARRAQPDPQAQSGESAGAAELAGLADEFGGCFKPETARVDRRGQLLRNKGLRGGCRIAHGRLPFIGRSMRRIPSRRVTVMRSSSTGPGSSTLRLNAPDQRSRRRRREAASSRTISRRPCNVSVRPVTVMTRSSLCTPGMSISMTYSPDSSIRSSEGSQRADAEPGERPKPSTWLNRVSTSARSAGSR